jgi:hypothetical protein
MRETRIQVNINDEIIYEFTEKLQIARPSFNSFFTRKIS